jgi:uncharacterized membrane protein
MNTDRRRNDNTQRKHDPLNTPAIERFIMTPGLVTAIYIACAVVALVIFVGLASSWKMYVTSRTIETNHKALVATTLQLLAEHNVALRNMTSDKATKPTPYTSAGYETCAGEGDFCNEQLDSMAHPTKATMLAIKAATETLRGTRSRRSDAMFDSVKVTVPVPDTIAHDTTVNAIPLLGTLIREVEGADGIVRYHVKAFTAQDGTLDFMREGMFVFLDQKIRVEKSHELFDLPPCYEDCWIVYVGARGSASVIAEETFPLMLIDGEEMRKVLQPFLAKTMTVTEATRRARIHELHSIARPTHEVVLVSSELPLMTQSEMLAFNDAVLAETVSDPDDDACDPTEETPNAGADDSQLSLIDDLEPSRGDIVDMASSTSVGAGMYAVEKHIESTYT